MKRNELELLNAAKELLKDEVGSISFTTWINPLEIKEITDNKITLLVTTGFQRDVIEKKYLNLIKNTFTYLTNKEYEVSTFCTEGSTDFTSMPIRQSSNSTTGLNPNYTF